MIFFTPLGLNHTHNICAATNLDIPLRQTTHYGTYSMTSIASSAWTDLQRNTNKKFLCKISEYHKRSYSKHTLLSTAIATKLFQDYLTKTRFTTNFVLVSSFIFFLFFLSSFYLFLFCCHYHSFIIFLLFFTFGKDTYHRKYFFCLIVRWIMSTTSLGIAGEICFQCLVNLSKLIDFCSVWNHQKTLIS